jgi:hypothetical protein
MNIKEMTARDFERARNKAFFRDVLALFRGHPSDNQLLSFDEVRRLAHIRERRYGGVRSVPVDKIVGSVGRYKDFDRAFLPRRTTTKDRWRSIDEAYYEDIALPPVQLYKVGDVYFVKDGNHRVSVAREQGVSYIDAEVIECEARVPITSDIQAEDLHAIGEYADFLEWSHLDTLRPDQHIEFTVPGGYARLEEHIAVHRYYLGLEKNRPIPLEYAVAHWYDHVYMPVVRLIREFRVLDRFPGRTEADLYLWIMDHLYYLRQRYGDRASPRMAVKNFAEQYGARSILEAIWQRIRNLAGNDEEQITPTNGGAS